MATTTSRTDAAAMAARLRLSATRLARQLRQQSDAGLSPSQLSALSAIEQVGPVTLGALADYERVAPPSVTKVVTKLEAAGLVTRQPDAADRRVVRVSTTTAGNALLARIRQRKTMWLTARIGALEPGERDRLLAALDVLDALTRDSS
ncbi:MAG: putative MarR-family transcriptional regulator [Acidimicrobiales bacterium]|jgi:DNA-binding MarR family transcriptional regulator|nr:putative MarR-family transcriptional regulator [Acidimicrobiales bacterium]